MTLSSSSSLQEYEQLAAQLDGARTALTKKVNSMSQAAAKEDIVERAEKHAENLAKLAKELQEWVIGNWVLGYEDSAVSAGCIAQVQSFLCFR